MEEREIVLPYVGSDREADKSNWYKKLQDIENKYLAYFTKRPGIFEDDSYEYLKHHFFFIYDEGNVILIQAESSNLPPEILKEVHSVFHSLYAPIE